MRRARSTPLDSFHHEKLVLACGDVTSATVELANHPSKVDHVWILLDCGIGDPVTISVNTTSRKSAEAGFDDRLRVGRAAGRCQHLPPRGLRPLAHYDYGEVESEINLFYEHAGRSQCEDILLSLAKTCDRMEAWGAPYHRRGQPGLHQIHSRRASCAVTNDLTGSDGGLKFYHRCPHDVHWTLLLVKFCGQP